MADPRNRLAGINLNLFPVLDAMLRHQSVRRSAEELGVTNAADLAVILDIAVQYGGGGCRRRMREAARDGRLDVGDLIITLPAARMPRRRRVYNRSPFWVPYIGGLDL